MELVLCHQQNMALGGIRHCGTKIWELELWQGQGDPQNTT